MWVCILLNKDVLQKYIPEFFNILYFKRMGTFHSENYCVILLSNKLLNIVHVVLTQVLHKSDLPAA